MMDNINTNTMVGKVVAVCIALLFIVVLAFPIANSLSNMGGNGGGSGEDELQKTVINSWDNSVGLTSTKYKSYDVYIPSETPTLPHELSYTLEDIYGMIETFTPIGESDEEINISFIFVAEGNQGINVFFDEGKMMVNTPIMTVELNEVDSITLNIATDYTVSYSLKTSDSDEVQTGQFTANMVSVLSESEYGWERFDSDEKVAVGSKLIVIANIPPESESFTFKQIELTQDMFSDNQLQFTVDWGEGYHSDVTISITPDTIPGVSKVGGWNIESVDGLIYYLTTYGTLSSDNNTIVNMGEHYYAPRENSSIDYLFRVVDDAYVINSSPDLGESMGVVVARIPYVEDDKVPYLCLAFGEQGSLWLSKGGYICMARSGEYGTTGMTLVQSTATISETGEYDSHNYGNMYGLDYCLAVDGTYVYSENHPKASLTDTIYISAPTIKKFNGDNWAVSVHSFGTPQNALDNIAGNYDTKVTNVDAHYTVGDYVTIDSADVSFTIDGNSGEMTVSGFFVPKTFTYESPDSGSDSEGLGGIASTLVKLVPILLIVSLLLVFIVPMVYKPN